MKIFILWYMSQCSPLKINGRFGRTCLSSGLRVYQARNQQKAGLCFIMVTSLVCSSTLGMEAKWYSETYNDFQLTVRCYIQKIEFIITTVVRISDRTCCVFIAAYCTLGESKYSQIEIHGPTRTFSCSSAVLQRVLLYVTGAFVGLLVWIKLINCESLLLISSLFCRLWTPIVKN
jgi:hypothetical protein